jgi:putative transcriptional regulator
MQPTHLHGQFLLAMPNMGDERFTRSVIYVLSHDADGAMGFIVNQPTAGLTLEDIGAQLPDAVRQTGLKNIPAFVGGPVASDYGFILHSTDYPPQNPSQDALTPEQTMVGMTQSLEILIDAAQARGPQHMRLLLGYAGWGAGQLEAELQDNAWLTCPATMDDIFSPQPEALYQLCAQRLGFDLALLSQQGGDA